MIKRVSGFGYKVIPFTHRQYPVNVIDRSSHIGELVVTETVFPQGVYFWIWKLISVKILKCESWMCQCHRGVMMVLFFRVLKCWFFASIKKPRCTVSSWLLRLWLTLQHFFLIYVRVLIGLIIEWSEQHMCSLGCVGRRWWFDQVKSEN